MLIRFKDMKTVDATNRVDDAFKAMDRGVLSIFFTAGYPRRDDTQPILHALSKSDVDLVEIGIPFSDPIADGKVIQHSNQVALENGMTLVRLFQQLREMRKEVDIPIILMGYLNPIFHYGFENFCSSCEDVGVDGMIIPDLPLHEVANGYGEIARNHNLTNSLIISPKSTSERIKKIDGLSTGFNYLVSTSSTTGIRENPFENTAEYFVRIGKMALGNPSLIGFGIGDNQGFSTACKYADGAIIGSAFIQVLDKSQSFLDSVGSFVEKIRYDHTD